MQGKIIKGIAGFYYVDVPAEGVYECKAKGIFRKDNTKPLVGDDVVIEITDAKDYEGNIVKLLPRKSALIRPAVANIDQALLIFAVAKPEPNYNLLDRFLIMMRRQGLDCIICFNKTDIADARQCMRIREIYEKSGCSILFASAARQEGIEKIKKALMSKTTAVAGPSGVGKSSLVNCLQEGTQMETGEISAKIERGRHTTRHSELIAISEGTYIMDTPGFSSLSLFDIGKEELKEFYPEFAPYEAECRFLTCAHIHEPDCGVKRALEENHIHKIRYANYTMFYGELKEMENATKSMKKRGNRR
ncbi:MAG: ribosome small subunit-dependent GTPase A [Lachnospiraceae bacterium]|nr:ribosome small subunit-dependent GTPase A [Lachnospiraceae bacterium]